MPAAVHRHELTPGWPVTNGKLKNVHHFDSKAEVEEYIREMPDGNWGLALPTPADAPIPLFDAEDDTGKFVNGIFLNREKLLGERIYGATAYYTPTQIIEEFKQSYPKVADKASYNELPPDVYKGILGSMGLPESFQVAMLETHQLFAVAGYYGGAKLDTSQAVSWHLRDGNRTGANTL
jgi:hypothetical protein